MDKKFEVRLPEGDPNMTGAAAEHTHDTAGLPTLEAQADATAGLTAHALGSMLANLQCHLTQQGDNDPLF